jgi:DNA-binding MarR family transcriptional regulator
MPNYIGYMNEQQKYQKMIELIFRVINKFQAIEQIPQHFGTEEMLYPREIHTIQAIGNYPNINVTDLADKLGITKGTISPIVTKLAKRKLVVKFKDSENHKEVLLSLTPKGEVAYHSHEMFEQQIRSRFFDMFEKATPENLEFLKEFLQVSEEKS